MASNARKVRRALERGKDPSKLKVYSRNNHRKAIPLYNAYGYEAKRFWVCGTNENSNGFVILPGKPRGLIGFNYQLNLPPGRN